MSTLGFDAYGTLIDTAGIAEALRPYAEDQAGEFSSFWRTKHLLHAVGAFPEDAWLVSGNPFDVIGAVSADLHGAWVKHSPHAVFDPREIEPTMVVDNLADQADAVIAYHRTQAPCGRDALGVQRTESTPARCAKAHPVRLRDRPDRLKAIKGIPRPARAENGRRYGTIYRATASSSQAIPISGRSGATTWPSFTRTGCWSTGFAQPTNSTK
jgi:hypothetical protein